MKKKILLAVVGAMMLASIAGCGNKDKVENTTSNVTTTTEATNSDAVIVDASVTDASPQDASIITAGYYDGNIYYNDFAEFKISVEDSKWKFYDAAGIASAAGIEETEVTQFWNGEISPLDQTLSYCAIAYNKNTGSNVIVNYFNPAAYAMTNVTAKDYLEMGQSAYEGAVLSEDNFVGKNFSVLTIPADESYGQVMYAYDKNDIIVMITFTVMKGDSLDDCKALFSEF